jgi:hypothetical protein
MSKITATKLLYRNGWALANAWGFVRGLAEARAAGELPHDLLALDSSGEGRSVSLGVLYAALDAPPPSFPAHVLCPQSGAE